MNILLFDFGSYIQSDLLFFLEKAGHRCRNVAYDFADEDRYHNEKFERVFEKEVTAGSFDLVMSTNFFPVIGRMCQAHDLRYIAWHYDSPMNLTTYDYFDLPCNTILLFDRAEAESLRQRGIDTVHHLPLAVNTKRLLQTASAAEKQRWKSDIAFVGALYASTLPVLTSQMTPYQKGYIDALIRVQSELYGVYLLDTLLDASFTEEVNRRYKELSPTAMQITDRQLTYAAATHITHLERLSVLKLLAESADVLLCTKDISDQERQVLAKVRLHGAVDYHKEMPAVFASAAVNLNITVKCTQTAIPLRALDIMGSGGFLLSNYQQEMAEYLIPDEEVVLYESIADAVEKARYYLAHEEERKRIAANGLARMEKDFRYEDRIDTMLRIAGFE